MLLSNPHHAMPAQTPLQTKGRPGLTWKEICHDPRFRDLPYKIETNARGQIIMSPTYQRHGALQTEIVVRLRELPTGRAVTESSISTSDGEKIADAVWFSDERWETVKDTLNAPIAPEICVEVRSPGNSDDEMEHKRALYFEAGAEEVWICDTNGHLRFYDAEGERDRSDRATDVPSKIEI